MMLHSSMNTVYHKLGWWRRTALVEAPRDSAQAVLPLMEADA